MLPKFSSFLAGLALALAIPFSHATTLEFGSLANPDNSLPPYLTSYSQDGFLLGTRNNGVDAFDVLRPEQGGAVALQVNAFGSVATLSRQGGAFSFLSISLSPIEGYGDNPEPFELLFSGVDVEGNTVWKAVSLHLTPGFQTYTFTEFGNVTEISWAQAGIDGVMHRFDAIELGEPLPLPEPAPLLLLGLGLAALALQRRAAKPTPR